MPKRSLDASSLSTTMPMDKGPKKTERSHEENQERAYIAASRRADRSIEARVQSAKMASEIHKKRTGKGFKISEAIVQAEEMYEEEEDDMPRSYRLLAAHLQTGSAEMNYRVNAFLANRVAMASMVAGLRNEEWAQNPINKMFAEQFPNANKQAQALSHNLTNSMYYQPVAPAHMQQQHQQPSHNETPVTSPVSPTFGTVNFQQNSQQPTRDGAQSAASPMDMSTPSVQSSAQSPPPMSPALPTSAISPMKSFHAAMFPADSLFTPELPGDVTTMGPQFDFSDPMVPVFHGNLANPWEQQAYYPGMADLKSDPNMSDPLSDYSYVDSHLNPYAPRYEDGLGDAATPGAVANENWDAFVDYGDQNDTGAVDPAL
ncbi:hypothetical protein CSOJ01_09566 [Colletotrichum sojae]|uniref:Uncharacterized protein n=1 Tax=Colletotrichum sojae TaxID=2175907 RepID=A0A8H6J3E8_9PEZI|nr:hypothetical protein CSOJ01_09566 [Colletotrichum sojae]